MRLEEVLTEEWFWAAAAALFTLAGLVGGMVAWIVGSIVRHRGRPEPEWSAGWSLRGNSLDSEGSVLLDVTLSNVGDGVAYSVSLHPKLCILKESTTGRENPSIAVMRPGDSIDLTSRISLDVWRQASIKVKWGVPPTRLGKTLTHDISPHLSVDEPVVGTGSTSDD